MVDCKCSFAITLIKDDFACEQAQMVTRRSGPDTACASELGSQRCQQLYDELKAVGLPAFDAEDDLLKTPASVFSKIQFGGLLGLAKIIAKASSNESNIVRVENIYQLLEQAVTRYESLSNIPYPELVDTMTAFKIKRKR
ncbi:MAG: hypothetical protein KJO47_05450 [Gammaproteobacteria bacterium]|nr:hypothetical protein [Gammaproteobacteria bacterium]